MGLIFVMLVLISLYLGFMGRKAEENLGAVL
jgi:hypothetical protein